MRDRIGDILDRWGQTVTVCGEEGSREIKAFLQPSPDKNEQVPEGMSSLGWLDGRPWLYLGQDAVEAGDTVSWNGRVFRVRSSRPYSIGETVLYWWASLEQEAA